MTFFIEGLVLTLLVLGAFQLFARWSAARDDRRQRLLEESWAIYRASRVIHDQTTEALQAMLDAARAQRGEGS
jgi:hypothetical protein